MASDEPPCYLLIDERAEDDYSLIRRYIVRVVKRTASQPHSLAEAIQKDDQA